MRPGLWWVMFVPIVGCRQTPTQSGAPAKEPADGQGSAVQAARLDAGAPPLAEGKPVKLSHFGEVTIADGACALMDGGIHGVQGHTLVVEASGDATWERRLDGMQPSGKAGSGRFRASAAEKARLHNWSDQLWQLASGGKKSFDPPIEQGPPRWVWAIVLRRGDEVRVLDGGGISSPTGAPEPAQGALHWLVSRVDELSAAEP